MPWIHHTGVTGVVFVSQDQFDEIYSGIGWTTTTPPAESWAAPPSNWLHFAGIWMPSTAYQKGDVVLTAGSGLIQAKAGLTTGTTFTESGFTRLTPDQNAGITVGATAPSILAADQLFWSKATETLYRWDQPTNTMVALGLPPASVIDPSKYMPRAGGVWTGYQTFGPGAGELWYDDLGRAWKTPIPAIDRNGNKLPLVLADAPAPPTSSIVNLQPYSDFQTGATINTGGSNMTGGTCAFDTINIFNTAAAGARSVKLAITTSSWSWSLYRETAMHVAVTPGGTDSESYYVWTAAAGQAVVAQMDWMDASHNYVTTTGSDTPITLAQNGFTRIPWPAVPTPTGTSPAVAFGALKLVPDSGFSSGTATLWVSSAQFEAGSTVNTFTSWIDPGNPAPPTGGGGGGTITTSTTLGYTANSAANAAALETRLNITISTVGSYFDPGTFPLGAVSGASITNNFGATQAAVWRKGNANKTMDVGVPLGTLGWGWIGDNAQMLAIAAGNYDANFRAAFQMLVDNGWEAARLRIGWEMVQQCIQNGTSPANYIAAYRHVITLAWSISSKFRSFFCFNGQGGNPDAYYPGDAYVNIYGGDFYYWFADGTVAGTIAKVHNGSDGSDGLNKVVTFAKAHNLQIAVGEWGNTTTNNGLGDNAATVADMAAWGKQNLALYLAYYDNASGVGLTLGTAPVTTSALGTNFAGLGPGAIVTPVTVPYRINCGYTTADYTDPHGNVWHKDTNTDGGINVATTTIAGDTVGDVMLTGRWGSNHWPVPVPNGAYPVNLYFAELNDGSGARSFDVKIEGTTVLTAFSPKTAAGGVANKQYVAGPFTAHVTDGELDVDFVTGTNLPLICGIEILT